MQIFRDKVFIALAGLFLVLISVYLWYIQQQKELLQTSVYTKESRYMREKVQDLINAKQKGMMAVAIAISHDNKIKEILKTKSIDVKHFQAISEDIKEHTVFKNVWLQLIDVNGISLFRSWSSLYGDNLKLKRKDISFVSKKRTPIMSISSDKYDLSIKALVPIIEKNKILGELEVITHFNSISRALKKSGIESIVLLNKYYTKQLEYPFSKNFLGEFYIANLDVSKKLLNNFKNIYIDHFLKQNNNYYIKKGYLLVKYPLQNYKNETIGSFLMLKPLTEISDKEIKTFTWQSIGIGIIVLLLLFGLIHIFFFFKVQREKRYYKKILDASNNMFVITNGEEIIDVNQSFYYYFKQYSSLEEFTRKHSCVCDFFVKENGYLQTNTDGINWIEFVIKQKDKSYIVKMNIEGKIYYFKITGKLVSVKPREYVTVFADITTEEEYRLELEYQSIIDPLTGIYNRRYFERKISEEITRCERYEMVFSLIMLDIDFFKRINDTYGHDVGDKVLQSHSALILENLRESDILCRVGGEEFMIILPQTTQEQAYYKAEDLRKKVQNEQDMHLQITMSFGVAQFHKADTYETLYKRVDTALYKAKESGRNKVAVL
ncbi:sensor domain-containing diguanylate cyclase [Sulfurimonas autotrophica]|uniref:diguanylate cyclase n=1 Tax=Sulfurimonas autotrophica (strain ATCC BAA-671 / DSM 16294 / JCM 11897 / OK10) TaxID=563040 RepID=E0UUH5_SULAO|nr:diguanylate cyclase [Sulfurimonas autotrophica]ADN08411.1 diguanylate cyclase [Sulfurimonas autotrophica DSM 16294]